MSSSVLFLCWFRVSLATYRPALSALCVSLEANPDSSKQELPGLFRFLLFVLYDGKGHHTKCSSRVDRCRWTAAGGDTAGRPPLALPHMARLRP
jgi:hypothetical protein